MLKKIIFWTIALLAIMALVFIGCTGKKDISDNSSTSDGSSEINIQLEQNSPSVNWEYTHVYNNGGITTNQMQRANELGAQGWELIAGDYYSLYFKRRLP